MGGWKTTAARRWGRFFPRLGLALVVVLAFAVLARAADAQAAGDSVSLLGGPEAFERLMGPLDTDPDRFVASLNRSLLETLEPGHDWQRHDGRRAVVELLVDLELLRRRFGDRFEVGLGTKPQRRRFAELGDTLGYRVRAENLTAELTPMEDASAARRRRLALALGWDLSEVARELGGGAKTLELPLAAVRLPLTASEWRQVTGEEMPAEDVLLALVKDQRLSLALEARRRVTAETWSVLSGELERSLYQNAQAFLRYAPALEVRDGHLVLPGGDEARPAWSSLVRSDADEGAVFLGDLLTKRGARPAFLLHSLSFLPPSTVAFYLGAESDSSLARRLLARLDEASAVGFDVLRGGDEGFGAFVRSVPLTANGKGFALPGGLGVWYAALRADDPPADHASLTAQAIRAGASPLEGGDFLLRTLSEENDVRGVKVPALRRLVRTAAFFGGRADLLTPENVLLLARTSDTSPMALRPLEVFRFTRPEPIRDYLLAVAALERRGKSADQELLLTIFQGGAEYLRVMALAGLAGGGVLEDGLLSWSRLHLQDREARGFAAAQQDWLLQLQARLPAVDQGPGRGPLERRFVASLAGARAAVSFRWQGLDYRGERSLALMRAMAAHLERQGIPSIDALAELHAAFDSLARESGRANAGGVRAAVDRALVLVGDLPEPAIVADSSNQALWRRVLPAGREELVRRLERMRKANRPDRLRELESEVGELVALLEPELRLVFLAPAYLHAMGDQDNVLYRTPDLVRKHLLYRTLDSESPADHAWRAAEVASFEGVDLGVHVLGHVRDGAAALAESSSTAQSDAMLVRDRVWFGDFSDTRWSDLDPTVTRAIEFLMRSGGGILDQAAAAWSRRGPFWLFVVRRIPAARLEAEYAARGPVSRCSPSERLALGLAALEGDGFGDRVPLDQATIAEWNQVRGALGAGWKDRLDAAGASTPALNGRARRFVGTWPPYELLEHEKLLQGLVERQLLDVRLRLVEFLGKRQLPGEVGRDLALPLQRRAGDLRLLSHRDWEGHIAWINQLSDGDLDEMLRGLLEAGLYTVADG